MFEAVHRYDRALLVLSNFTPPKQIADQVAQAIHARDYQVTVDYVCNIRNKEVDRLFKQSEMWTRSLLRYVPSCGLRPCFQIEQQYLRPLVAPPACATEDCQPSACTTSLSTGGTMMVLAMAKAAKKSGLLVIQQICM
jgi:hypothetical protein